MESSISRSNALSQNQHLRPRPLCFSLRLLPFRVAADRYHTFFFLVHFQNWVQLLFSFGSPNPGTLCFVCCDVIISALPAQHPRLGGSGDCPAALGGIERLWFSSIGTGQLWAAFGGVRNGSRRSSGVANVAANAVLIAAATATVVAHVADATHLFFSRLITPPMLPMLPSLTPPVSLLLRSPPPSSHTSMPCPSQRATVPVTTTVITTAVSHIVTVNITVSATAITTARTTILVFNICSVSTAASPTYPSRRIRSSAFLCMIAR